MVMNRGSKSGKKGDEKRNTATPAEGKAARTSSSRKRVTRPAAASDKGLADHPLHGKFGSAMRNMSKEERLVTNANETAEGENPAAVATDDDESEDRKRAGLRCCGGIFFQSGVTDKYKRAKWAHGPEHLIAQTSATVGIAQLLLFPETLAREGGATFFLAYVVFSIFLTYPLMCLEMCLGQFSSLETVTIFRRMCPISVGIGWASVFLAFVRLAAQLPLLGTCLLFAATTVPAPTDPSAFRVQESFSCERLYAPHNFYFKGLCFHRDNIHFYLDTLEDCIRRSDVAYGSQPQSNCSTTIRFNPELFPSTSWLQTYEKMSNPFLTYKKKDACGNDWGSLRELPSQKPGELRIALEGPKAASVASELNRFLTANGLGLEELMGQYCGERVDCLTDALDTSEKLSLRRGVWGWDLGVCTGAVVAALIGLSLAGIAFSAFHVTFLPLMGVLSLILYGMCQDGWASGVLALWAPRWCGWASPGLWLVAIRQALLSTPLGLGVVPTLSSYGSFHQDVFLQAGVVVFTSILFSVLSSLATGALLGSVTRSMRRSDLAAPDVLTLLASSAEMDDVSALLGRTLLLVILIGGLGSSLALLETLVCHGLEHIPYFLKRRPQGRAVLTPAFALLALCASLPFLFFHGEVWADELQWLMLYLVSALIGATCVALVWVYGVRRWSADMELMLGCDESEEPETPPLSSRLWRRLGPRVAFSAVWVLCPPVLLVFFLAAHIITESSHSPGYLSLGLTLTVVLIAVGSSAKMAVSFVWKRRQSWGSLQRPMQRWGPALLINRIGIYALLPDDENSNPTISDGSLR